MEEEEEQQQQQTTFDDVFHSIRNSDKIGRFSRKSRLNQINRRNLSSFLSASKPRPEGATRPWLREMKDQRDEDDVKKVSTTTTTTTTENFSPLPPSPILHFNYHHQHSISKLRRQHSISTPELHSKFMSSPHQAQDSEVKLKAAHRVDFSDHHIKENADPGILHLHSSSTFSSSSSSSPPSSPSLLHPYSSFSLSHLHTIPSSSTFSSSQHQPLKELPAPRHPPPLHRTEGGATDLPHSPVLPRHPIFVRRRRGMLRNTLSTTSTTPSPPQEEAVTTAASHGHHQPASTTSPDTPALSVVTQRSTPLVRSCNRTPQCITVAQQTASRSNTASEVKCVMGRSQQAYTSSNTALEVKGVLGRSQQTASRSNTASEVKGVLGKSQQTASRSNTASEVEGVLGRVQQAYSRSLPATVIDTALTGLQPHTHSPQLSTDSHKNRTHTATDTLQPKGPTASQTNTRMHTNTDTSIQTPRPPEMSDEGAAARQRPLPAPSDPPAPAATPVSPPTDLMTINGKQYLKLQLLGRGGSSKVFEVLDKESKQMRAVKVVNLQDVDEDTLISYKNEISILERLRDCSRVIHLYDHKVTGSQLVLVMERGSVDFTTILNESRAKKGCPIPFFTIQHYWAGMLCAVQQIHQHGIIHSDLKPANFLLVDGTVKLIDFGIASAIQHDMTSVIKDSQAGTFNYMSPESLLDIHSGPIVNNCAGSRPTIKIRVKSDVWSLGCILYNLVYGRTPFQHIINPLQKLTAISNPNTRIDFPETKNKHLVDVMRMCLQHDPCKRPSIEQLLDHPLLTG